MKKALISLLVLLSFFSCKKNAVDNETVSVTDYAFATQEYLQLFLEVNASAVSQKGLYIPQLTAISIVGKSDSLSGDTTHDAQGVFTNLGNLPTLWIRYTNCTGVDGKIRNGTIKIAFGSQYSLVGCTANISLVNYTVNGVSFSGTFSLMNSVLNQISFSSNDSKCTGGNKTISCTANYTLCLFTPYTSSCSGCEYVQAFGSARGTNQDGKTFEASLNNSNPLKKESTCSWISKGTVSITPSGLHTRTVDFGSGTCDDIASFTVDGQTYTVHMSK